jgi:uncharacterized protein (DUF2236 family)
LSHPGPDSLLWRIGGDWTTLLGGGRALILQVAHPVVAAGVGQHSDYTNDPWSRLNGTLELFQRVIFGGRRETQADAGARLRSIHKRIKGVRPDGERYHALEPGAFFWVHATLLDGLVEVNTRFGRPLKPYEHEAFYAEMCEVGRLYGLRDRDMPPDWRSFRVYFDRVVADELEDSDTLQQVIATIFHPSKPPVVPLPDQLWGLATWPGTELIRLATVGMLPPVLRERLGLPWSRERELALRANSEAIRRLFPLLPERVRLMPAALAARRGETLVEAA